MTPPHEPPSYDEADPFDLPDWLGECEVTWEADHGLDTGHRVAGALTAPGREPLACDLLAVDDAYPEPAAADAVRVRTHQVWRHGEVLVAADGPRVLLVVRAPGSTPRPPSTRSVVWPGPSVRARARTPYASAWGRPVTRACGRGPNGPRTDR